MVEAACACLVPSDDLPGAREANVVGFIDGQLADPNLAVFAREVKAGVRALDRVADASFGSRFLDIDSTRQGQVLAAIQDGEGGDPGFSTQRFFQVLLTLTLEGLLSDPAHGGNKDRAGWKIMGVSED